MWPADSTFPEIEHVSVSLTPAPVPLFTAHTVASAYPPLSSWTIHCQAIVAVPVPESVLVTVNAWLTSSAVALGEGVLGAVSAVLTVTLPLAVDVVVDGVDAESVSWISYVYAPTATVAPTTQFTTRLFEAVPLGVAHCVVVAVA